MIDPTFLSMLMCPATKQPLRTATAAELAAVNGAIAAGRKNRSGGTPTGPWQEALATADGAWLYPIQEGIPILLSAEAVAPAEASAR
jgi:uncharacterized protein YbaR (Trm112 family)